MLTKRFSGRAPVQLLSSWLQLPRSTFYYKPHAGQRGMKPSTHTLYKGSLIANEEVVEKIKELISGPYNAYGYQSINDDLRALGYLINHKKTYRLMDFHKLLLGKVIRTSGKRNWVQYRNIFVLISSTYGCKVKEGGITCYRSWMCSAGKSCIGFFKRVFAKWM
jgi:putative transposase